MQVDVLRSTDHPERLVCQAARGDYYDGYIGDTNYWELMKSVQHDEEHLPTEDEVKRRFEKWPDLRSLGYEKQRLAMAKTRAFIEKQLSRGHYGPAEHPYITFSVEGVSRVTMAQITRHRHMTFDVQSQRYVDFSDKSAVIPQSLRDPDHFSRETGKVDLDIDRDELLRAYKSSVSQSFARYEQLVENGVPKEDARFLLPIGTPVNMTFSGNARTFMHVFNMRRKADSQWEIRELSEELASHLKEWAPYTFNWYEDNMPHKIGP